MLNIQNFIKKFGDKPAVNDVSLQLQPNEIVCIIGPNGSGKTTLIKTIAGLLKPSAGQISVAGHDVVNNPDLAKSQLGYIPDEPTVWSSVTGEEFLHIVGALYSIDAEKRTERIKQLLPIFNLQGLEKDYFEDYSRGNKQKFSILAALLHQPKVLLIDEPIVGLDPTSAEIAKKQFQEFAEKGGSVLLVTHTLPVAEETAHRIGFLQNGKLAALGTMAELRNQVGLSSEANLEAIYSALANKNL